MKLSLWMSSFAVVIAATPFGACSSAPCAFCGAEPDGAADVTVVDSPLTVSDAQPDACPKTHCSADLHDVVCDDGTGTTMCAANEGCANGACVAACDAANANQSSVGCDYWTIDPDTIAVGECFAVFIANTWGSPVSVSVDRAGVPFTNVAGSIMLPQGSGMATTYAPLPSGQIPAEQVGILFVSATPNAVNGCPAGITPLVTMDAAQYGTGIGNAFHIATTAPVVAYQMHPYGGGNSEVSSATLLLPTSSWGTNYVGVDAYGSAIPGTYNAGGPSMVILASQDHTTVTLTPTSQVIGGHGVPAMTGGFSSKLYLDKGQYAQIIQPAHQELNGTPILANNPIAVFGGHVCMYMPEGTFGCDGETEQIPPISALGTEYVGVKYRDRYEGTPEAPPWHVIGVAAGTTLTWDPAPPTGAPTTLEAGQMVEFSSGGPFVVKSQDALHPFYLGQYMSSCRDYSSGSTDCRGDPELVDVIPPQQYLGSYVLFTDPTYSETELVVVREPNVDVTLDCAGLLTGWQPIGTSGKYEYTRVDLVTGNFQKVGSCDNGRHTMTGTGYFGVTVWGWGSQVTGTELRGPPDAGFYTQAVSYGYPAGASLQPINTVTLPPN